MVVPYKQIILDQGLLVLYEQAMTSDTDPETSRPTLHVITSDGFYYIQIGEDHLVLLDEATLSCIISTKKIYLAYSEKENLMGTLDGFIDLDAISLGKLLAHLEAFAQQLLTA